MSGPPHGASRPSPGRLPTHTRHGAIKEAISSAALELVLARGLDAVTVDEIARAANVSRRTFFNYFPSKAAACIPGTFPPDKEAVRRFLSDRTVPTLSAVGRMLGRQVAMARRETPEFDRFHDMWRREQAVRPEIYAVLARVETELAATIAKRDGFTRDAIAPASVAAASIAILRVAVDQWRSDESPELLEDRIRESFEAVAGAMEPTPGNDTGNDTGHETGHDTGHRTSPT